MVLGTGTLLSLTANQHGTERIYTVLPWIKFGKLVASQASSLSMNKFALHLIRGYL